MVAPVSETRTPQLADLMGMGTGTVSQTKRSQSPSPRALRTLEAAGRQLDARDPAVVKQTAAQLMSELFFAPLLAEMRRFPFGRELTGGGQTEAVFGEQLDRRIADGVAAADTGLMKQMLRQLEPKGRHAASADSAPRADRSETGPTPE